MPGKHYGPYSPNGVEDKFCELRLYRVLRSLHSSPAFPRVFSSPALEACTYQHALEAMQ